MKNRANYLAFFLVFGLYVSATPQTPTPVDSVYIYLNQAISENNKAKECIHTHQLTVHYWLNGQTDSSLHYSQKLLDLSTEIKDTTHIIKALNNQSYNYQHLGEFLLAAEKLSLAIQLSKEKKDTLLWANSLENLSVIYGTTGLTDFPKAIDLLLQAAKLKEECKAYNMLAGTYKNISSIFKEMKDTLNREKYLLKSIKLVDEEKTINPTFKAAVYNEAGRFYTDEKADYPKANEYFNRVLDISQQLNWKKGISVSLSNMANVKELMGEYPQALRLLEQSLVIKQETNDYYGIVNLYHSMGEVYNKLKNPTEAINCFNKSTELATRNNLSNEIKKNYFSLYRVHSKSGNYKTALDFFERYYALSDSINGAEHKNKVAELETKYETEKKEQQIEKLTAEKEIETLRARQRKLIALILASLLGIIGLLFFFISRQNKLKNIRKQSELNQKLLRSQMNPHFLFNALGTIQNYMFNNNINDAGKYLAKFAKLMRNILESSVNELIPLEQEIETVSNYLALQQLKDNQNFSYSIKTEGEETDAYLPPMLVQPFIENAIKHGFTKDITDASLQIFYKFDDEYCTISVEDNGVGILSGRNNKDHKSYAIMLTCERLAQLNKGNKKENSIETTDLSEEGSRGTRVVIKFKQKTK